jgi:predicted GIY-YIG superfamily endonuclease
MPEENHKVYIFHNPETDEVYAGSTKDDVYRESKHRSALRNKRHPNYKFQRAYNRNPNFDFVSVEVENREAAFDLEQSIIDEFYGSPLFLNLSDDARHCSVGQSPDSIKRMKEKLVGRKLSPEHVEKLRQALLQEHQNNPGYNKGYRHSPEAIEKFRLSSTGRTHVVSPEAKEVMRQAKLGGHLSEEHKKKLSEVALGRKDPPETVLNKHLGMLYRAKPVVIDDVVYASRGLAAKELGLTTTTITNRVNAGIYKELNGRETSPVLPLDDSDSPMATNRE